MVKRVEFALENHSPPGRVFYDVFLDILELSHAFFLPSVSCFEDTFQHILKFVNYNCLLV